MNETGIPVKELGDLIPEELGKLFPVEIVPYDKNWIEFFRAERKLIQKILTNRIALKIEHFGSTAVEGLSAKPTIDILVEIPPLTDKLKNTIINKMVGLDYHFIWRTDETLPYMHFVKGYSPVGCHGITFHIHMGDKNHTLWDRIIFRDYLRNNQETAKDYEKLKIALAQHFRYDREAYTNAKEKFVKQFTELAKSEINRK
jgi:GrpB-like predicted nucleotidyltransferase (UPF0157 family)